MRRSKVDRLAWAAKVPGAIGAVQKASVPKRGKVTIKERDLQSMAEDLCDSLGIRWFRIPDKLLAFLHNFAPQWVRVFVSKYLKGVPDMMLFRKCETGDNIVRLIEIKTEAGKVSQGQRHWHRGLNVHVTYGWQETETAIRDFAGKDSRETA